MRLRPTKITQLDEKGKKARLYVGRRKRGDGRLRRIRGEAQGGGPFTKPAPAVRRARRRKQNTAARAARRRNRG